MGGFAVAFGQLDEDAWSRSVRDLSASPDESTSAWIDPSRSIRLARVARTRRAVTEHAGAVVVAEGEIDEEKIAIDYAKRGIDCTRQFSGDFAFALYDLARARLLVACDVVGGRTASFFWDGRVLVAATRTLAVLHHPSAPRKFDRVYRAHAVSDFWAQAAGCTAFEAIRRLRPGFALVLEHGACDVRRIDRLSLDRDAPTQTMRGEQACEAFRDLLDVVVRERVDQKSCIALSGGLDSTTVASSVHRVFGSIEALTIVDSTHPELDEHEAVAEFTAGSSIREHHVDAANDVPFDDGSAASPIADDPAVLSWAFSATRSRLWQRAKDLSFETVVNGEGGDEIFDVCVRATELGLRHDASALVGYLRAREDWRRVFVEEILAPRSALLRAGLAGHRNVAWFAPWMRPSFQSDRATQRARKEREKWLFLPRFAIAFPASIEIAAAVGSNAASKLAQDVIGVRTISPLLDRRIIEFFARLPPTEQIDPKASKSFLRRASSCAAIASRTKDTRLYCDLTARAFADHARREFLAERVLRSVGIGDDVDPRKLRDGFCAIARGEPGAPLVELAAALIQYAIWSDAVARSHGLR